MKKMMSLIVLVVALMVGIAFVSTGFAEEKVMTFKVDRVDVKKDKNGKEYTRLWTTVDKSLNGVKYKRSVPVMAFGEAAVAAKHVTKGQTVKAVVETGKFKDRETITLLGLAE